jgi:hypothetical protein
MALLKDGGNRLGERVWIARRGAAPVPAIVSGTDFLADAGKTAGAAHG